MSGTDRRHHPPASPRQDLPPQARQFDFWLGSWNVNLHIRQDDGTWKDSVQSQARIHPVLDGNAVLELWDAPTIKGCSLRYHDPAREKWHLWLNWPGANRSGSSGLAGSFRHGRGEFFSTRTRPDGSELLSRYTFSDITPARPREGLRTVPGQRKGRNSPATPSWTGARFWSLCKRARLRKAPIS